ncbi:DUF456 domain-containing protein [Sanguibacter sp. A247]|uniref:DUF456 domain-containing protein n=1 Tax=unclassified Sanguibacter TaxID=2645534 RepID=UPI003FD7B175
MEPWGELLVGLVIMLGLFGVLVQVLPGGFVVLGAILVWAIFTGGAAAWIILTVAALATVAAAIGKYLVAGRYMLRNEVRSSTLWWGVVGGIIGFFVIPVVGMLAGFPLGIYVAEASRRGWDTGAAWRATVVALKATGLSILVELAGAVAATVAWILGVLLT